MKKSAADELATIILGVLEFCLVLIFAAIEGAISLILLALALGALVLLFSLL